MHFAVFYQKMSQYLGYMYKFTTQKMWKVVISKQEKHA